MLIVMEFEYYALAAGMQLCSEHLASALHLEEM
jgi:hypothetical protein